MTIYKMEDEEKDDVSPDITAVDLNVTATSSTSIYKVNRLPQQNVPGFQAFTWR